MKRKTVIYAMLLAVLISACSAPATPTIDAASVQSTSAVTVVAEIQTALPTNTDVPSTEAPTQTPLPTDTLVPSPTLDIPATPTVVMLSPTDTFTPQPSTSGGDCNKPLLSWQGPSASFTIMNETKPAGNVILMMSVITETGECGYLHIYSDSFTGPAGTYSAAAFVNGKKSFKVFGAFVIRPISWKIIVRNDGIVAKGGCYPNC